MTIPHTFRRLCCAAATATLMVAVAACGSSSTQSTATTTRAVSPSTTAPVTTTTAAATTTSPGAAVVAAVQSAQSLQAVPSDVRPSLTDSDDGAGPSSAYGAVKCGPTVPNAASVPSADFGGCVYGDPTGSNLMVVYGDSHAQMWAEALQLIAARAGWRLEVFALPGCQLADLPLISYQTGTLNSQCLTFHQIAPVAIAKLHPNLIVATSISIGMLANGDATAAQWQDGLTKTFQSLAEPGTAIDMIGDIPQWSQNTANCLAEHMTSVQSCASPVAAATSFTLSAEQAASAAAGVKYIPTTQWVCAAMCEPIVDGIRLYINEYHFDATYTRYLSNALQEAMGLPSAAAPTAP